MKNLLKRISESGLAMVVIMLLCSVFGVGGAELMTADVVNPSGGGAVDINATTTAQ